MSVGPLERLAAAAIAAARRIRAPYAFGGGLAVNAWLPADRVRATYDVDIHLALPDELLDDFQAALAAAGAPAIHTADLTLARGRVKLRRFLWGDTTLDLLAAREPYGSAALARRTPLRLGRRSTFVLAPEDLILHKLLAYRASDRRDVAELVSAFRAYLDVGHLERWGRSLRLWSRVRAALGRR